MPTRSPETSRLSKQVLRLREEEMEGTRVPVDPANRILFVLTGRQLIQSCGLTLPIQLYVDEAGLAVADLGTWATERAGTVESIHWQPRPGHLGPCVAGSSGAFGFELADEMTDLNVRLDREFKLRRVEIFQVPADAVDRFVSSPERSRVWPARTS